MSIFYLIQVPDSALPKTNPNLYKCFYTSLSQAKLDWDKIIHNANNKGTLIQLLKIEVQNHTYTIIFPEIDNKYINENDLAILNLRGNRLQEINF